MPFEFAVSSARVSGLLPALLGADSQCMQHAVNDLFHRAMKHQLTSAPKAFNGVKASPQTAEMYFDANDRQRWHIEKSLCQEANMMSQLLHGQWQSECHHSSHSLRGGSNRELMLRNGVGHLFGSQRGQQLCEGCPIKQASNHVRGAQSKRPSICDGCPI